MKKYAIYPIAKALILILLAAISFGQTSLAQGDSDDESDTPTVHFVNAEGDKKPSCICIPPGKLEKAPTKRGSITPRLSLTNLPKKETKEDEKTKARKRSGSLTHRSLKKALDSARNLLSPTRNQHTQPIETRNYPRELEESLARMHAVFVIEEETLRIYPVAFFADLLRGLDTDTLSETNHTISEFLDIDTLSETNRSLYAVLREAIDRIPHPTIPSQYDRLFLNTLFTFIDSHLKASLINDTLQRIEPNLLIMALEKSYFNETPTNTVDWALVFAERLESILNENEIGKLKALRLFISKFIIHTLQNWEDEEIENELLTIAHIFKIQITAHAEIEEDSQKKEFAHIIAEEIYKLLEIIKPPTNNLNVHNDF